MEVKLLYKCRACGQVFNPNVATSLEHARVLMATFDIKAHRLDYDRISATELHEPCLQARIGLADFIGVR